MRGVRIRLGKMERSEQLIRQFKPGLYGFCNSRLKRMIYKFFSDTERIRIHGWIYNVLVEHKTKINLRDGYHLAVNACLSNQKNSGTLLLDALEANISLGRDHRVRQLFRLLHRYHPEQKCSFRYWFMLGEFLLLGGNASAAYGVFLKAFRKGKAENGVSSGVLSLLRTALCRKKIDSGFSYLRFLLNLPNSQSEEQLGFVRNELIREGVESQLFGITELMSHLNTVWRQAEESPDNEQALRAHYRQCLFEGNFSEAEERLIEILELNRTGSTLDPFCRGLLDLAVWHQYQGSIQRAFQVLKLAENQYLHTVRPDMRFKITTMRILLLVDQGKLAEAEASIIRCEQDDRWSCNFRAQLQYWRAMVWMRQNRQRDVFYLINKLSEVPLNGPLVVIRRLYFMLSELDAIDLNIRSSVAARLENRYRFLAGDCLYQQTFAVFKALLFQPESNRKHLEKKIEHAFQTLKRVYDFDGILKLNILSIRKRTSYLSQEFENLLEISNFPDYREYQVDLLFSRAETAFQTGVDNREAIRWLIRSKRIAENLKDNRRMEKINNLLGATYQVLSDFDCPSRILKLLLIAFRAMAHAVDSDSIEENLLSFINTLTGSSGGLLFNLNERGIEFQKRWGVDVSRTLQRQSRKVIARFLRTEKNIGLEAPGLVLRWPTTHRNSAAVFYFADCNIDVKLMENAIDTIREYAESRLKEVNNRNRFQTSVKVVDSGSVTKGLVGISAEIRKVRSFIERVSRTDSTVHITGETGVGKEVVAKAIHDPGPRKTKPFQAYNCAVAPKDMIESELFGHVRGAFTGALTTRKGIFAAAAGGTVFLDEVADLPPDTQTKILRFLQEREIRPLGSDNPVYVDVRIISATNKRLIDEVENKRFRKDLYFRLMVMEIEIPPLRTRTEDIEVLLNYFLAEYCRKMKRPVSVFDYSALKELQKYSWPGNVRELQNIVEVGLNLSSPGEAIKIEHISHKLPEYTNEKIQNLRSFIADQEKRYIERALRISGHNMTRTADLLGISRQGLFKKVHKYSIIVPDRHRFQVGEEI